MAIKVRRADPSDPADADAIVELTDAYARDRMGGGEPLEADVRNRLPQAILDHGGVHVLLAFDGPEPVGISTTILSFSTFAAAPALNIHDIAVIPEYRDRGVGRRLLDATERLAERLGCCRISLEVLEHNPAKRLYERAGFEANAEYWTKELGDRAYPGSG